MAYIVLKKLKNWPLRLNSLYLMQSQNCWMPRLHRLNIIIKIIGPSNLQWVIWFCCLQSIYHCLELVSFSSAILDHLKLFLELGSRLIKYSYLQHCSGYMMFFMFLFCGHTSQEAMVLMVLNLLLLMVN